MYSFLKRLALRILPKGLLFRAEPVLRRIYYQFYRGQAFYCNVCKSRLRRFIPMADGDLICPNCGSISRNRRLWQLINEEFIRDNTRILDFSPSRSLYREFKSLHNITYVATDISGDFISDAGYDITGIDAETGSYDLVICYHILEHVEEDRKAMSELYRILSGGGTCIVQTPFREGDIYEDSSLVSAEGRLEHFGQEDHVRIYSVRGLEERLSEAGFRVELKEYTAEQGNAGGLKERETILICRKLA
jgi:SAM-dependent methyltransferase